MRKQAQPGSPRRGFRHLGYHLHMLVLAGAIGLVTYAAVPYLHGVPAAMTTPSSMESVDWTSPYSSIYCLACHRQVAPAMAGLDVQQGHSHNVILAPEQAQAVQQMGTIIGPGNVLICMSCHKLGKTNPYMLADTLTDSNLCRRCHPQQFTLIGSKHDLRTSAPHEKNRLDQTTTTGGPCSACHLAHHYARDFEPCELDPDGRCITCHKIGRAAARLARPTMEHPKSQCIICHDPHNDNNQHYLKKPGAQMCADCHKDYVNGPAKGMHPLGAMDYDVPEALLKAGGETFNQPRQLTCLVCHSTHSSTHKPLLVMPADTNQLCLTCHDKQLTQQAMGGAMHKHALSPTLTAQQQAAVKDHGGQIGPNGQLLCVSCHSVHHAQSNASLLSTWAASPDACRACHPDKTSVDGTAHDLRTSFPNEKNLAGAGVWAAGTCSACHLAHGPAKSPAPTAADTAGQCTSCHQENACGKGKLAGSAGHPDTQCAACHDPHQNRVPHFLAKDANDLCRTCHADQYSLTGGPHDPSAHPDRWPKDVTDAGTPCLACHVTHGTKGSGLFRATRTPDSYRDAVCLNCHQENGWDANSATAAIHPRQIPADEKLVPLSLVPVDDRGNTRIGCRTCHNVHGGTEPAHLAQVKPGQPTADLCIHCHQDKKLIALTSHAPQRLASLGCDTDSCKPCHAMHARPDATWGQMLSPRFLVPDNSAAASRPAATEAAMSQPSETALPCQICHRPGGPAPVRQINTHPMGFMFNTIKPDEPGYMPLFNAQGKVDPNGQITCRTCHLSHGRLDLLKAAASQPMPAQAAEATKLQVRAFVTPNLCTQCHGADARRRFLFFHTHASRTPQG